MLFIIAHHFSVHGEFFFSSGFNINYLWIDFIQIGGKIGVNIFVLISGYFLINSQKVQLNKVLKLWIQIFTYSIIFFIIFSLTNKINFSLGNIIEYIFPITFSQWWFAST